MRHPKGFTMIELMLTIAIFAIIFVGAIAFTNSSMYSANFNTTVLEVKRMMLTAQNRALEGYNNANIGIMFDENQVVLFTGNEYDPEATGNYVLDLPPTITASEINFGVENTVLFTKYTGLPAQSGNIVYVSDAGAIADISINSNGVISISYE